MTSPLKIAFIASECVPYAKSGGLADVVGALPGALQDLGHEVIIILPLYKSINRAKFNIQTDLKPARCVDGGYRRMVFGLWHH